MVDVYIITIFQAVVQIVYVYLQTNTIQMTDILSGTETQTPRNEYQDCSALSSLRHLYTHFFNVARCLLNRLVTLIYGLTRFPLSLFFFPGVNRKAPFTLPQRLSLIHIQMCIRDRGYNCKRLVCAYQGLFKM